MKFYTKFSVPSLLIIVLVTICSLFFTPCNAQTPLFYGTTYAGGNVSTGLGTVFTFNPATNAENVAWNFGSGTDGSNPYGNLTYDPTNSTFYGMAGEGGQHTYGTIFSLAPNTNTESTTWSFANYLGNDGGYPTGSLVYDPNNGRFYGLTNSGGANSLGAIISFNPSTNTDSVVWSFGNGSDGAAPAGSLVYIAATNLFYGMTYSGGTYNDGTIFSFSTTGNTENALYSFGVNDSDGYRPYGDLIVNATNNALLGMTSEGGGIGSTKVGTIFSFNPTGNTETILWRFLNNSKDGAEPHGDLVYDATTDLYYGMTTAGGTNDAGTIFSFSTSTMKDSVLWDFGNTSGDGAVPWGNLVYYPATKLYYGLAQRGGTNDDGSGGTLFSFNTTTGRDSTLWEFGASNDGQNPYGSLVLYNGSAGINTLNSLPASVNIYPNPNNGNFTVQLQNVKQQNTQLEIFNVLGEKIYSSILNSTNTQLNLANTAVGVYLYKVLDAQGSTINEGKFVVE